MRNVAAERLSELSRRAPVALLLFSETGAVLARNEAAEALFGDASLAALLGSREAAADVVAAVRDRGKVSGEVEIPTARGRVWFMLQGTAATDPATGSFAVALAADDLTERRSADRAKDEFISIVNHELRTPLTAIRGAVGLLANDVVESPEQKAELFDIAWENVVRLGRLVDDLLDVQRLRLGAVDLVLATLEVAPLAHETLELLAPRAAEAGVTLALADEAPGALVRGDPGRLVQALANLVTNAIKHAPQGSEVRVEVQRPSPSPPVSGLDLARSRAVRVYVRDEGSGVPASFVPRLFAPFSQADSTDARSSGGAGLGLYIVRTLIEAHGGTVGYDASAPGGAAFYFELPAVQPHDAPPTDPRLDPLGVR